MLRNYVLLGLPLAVLVACGPADSGMPSAPRAAQLAQQDQDDQDEPFTYAIIGDRPYGADKLAEMPRLIAQINADRAVSLVIHVGDIEAGSKTGCLDTYFANIKSLFDTFEDPLVYTPGDNEWVDCHQYLKSNGLNTPTERLEAVRDLFFPIAGQTLGLHPMHVITQASDPAYSDYVENVTWTRDKIVFAVLNIQGSNNDLAPWFQDPATDMPANYLDFPTQADEFAARAKADSVWIAKAFERASRTQARGVVLAFQADMWDPAEPTWTGFDKLVEQIGTLAAKFRKPVLLLEGDSHVWRVDTPFAPGAVITPSTKTFAELHPVTPVAPNVTRHVVDGSGSPTSYTRLTIDPESGKNLFSLTRVPLQ
jgi:hypothetical protein